MSVVRFREFSASVFATGGHGGNPARVLVPDEPVRDLSRVVLVARAHATYTALAEPGGPFSPHRRVTFITPSGDTIPCCGHLTLAVAAALSRMNPATARIRMRTPHGVLTGWREPEDSPFQTPLEGAGDPVFAVNLAVPSFEPSGWGRADVAPLVGLRPEQLDPEPSGGYPVACLAARSLQVGAVSVAALDAARPDFHGIEALGAGHPRFGILYLSAPITPGLWRGRAFMGRSRAEDPASGTAGVAALAARFAAGTGESAHWSVRQGPAAGPGGAVGARLTRGGGRVGAVGVVGAVQLRDDGFVTYPPVEPGTVSWVDHGD